MIRLRYVLHGLGGLKRRLALMANPKKERQALNAIARYIHRQTMQRFETETDPWGRPWAPLKPSTLARRRHGGDRILQDTGRLKGGYHWLVRGDTAVVRAGVYYAAYHQFGTRTRTGRQLIPPRKMLPEHPWPKGYLEDIRRIVRRVYGVHRPRRT